MAKKSLFRAVATLVGCVIGAGILGIPYVVAKAGFLTGLVNIIGLGLIFLLINLYLGEVILRTKGTHQLTGYAFKYTGKIGKYFMFISMVVGIYGALIAYAMGSGEALAALTGLTPLLCSVIFFGLLSWLVYIGLGAIERSESFMLPVVLIIVLLISALAIFSKNFDISNLSKFSFANLLVPYGVVLFAFIGTSCIPEMKSELENNRKELKKAILIGSLIPLVIYILFAMSVVGVLGVNTHEVGALGLTMILGEKMSFIGAVFALCTMSTSFLALGLALKDLFNYDYNLRKNTSWLLACFIPFLLFLLIKSFNLANFVKVLEITGIITGAIVGILVVLMALNSKKKCERKPEYSVYINKFIAALLIIVFIIGAVNLLV